jgi:hypothetical protein
MFDIDCNIEQLLPDPDTRIFGALRDPLVQYTLINRNEPASAQGIFVVLGF